MVKLNSAYNAGDEAPPPASFDAIPAGKYPAVIMSSDLRQSGPNSATPGASYLALEWQVVDGTYRGRRIWTNLNLWHPKQQAVEIADRLFKRICHAVGVRQVEDTSQLHDKPHTIKVRLRKARDNFEASNDVVDAEPLGAGDTAPALAAPASSPGAATPAWAR